MVTKKQEKLQELVEDLNSTDQKKRVAAIKGIEVRATRDEDIKIAVPSLIAALSDKNPKIRIGATYCLGLGYSSRYHTTITASDVKPSLQKLVELLDDQDIWTSAIWTIMCFASPLPDKQTELDVTPALPKLANIIAEKTDIKNSNDRCNAMRIFEYVMENGADIQKFIPIFEKLQNDSNIAIATNAIRVSLFYYAIKKDWTRILGFLKDERIEIKNQAFLVISTLANRGVDLSSVQTYISEVYKQFEKMPPAQNADYKEKQIAGFLRTTMTMVYIRQKKWAKLEEMLTGTLQKQIGVLSTIAYAKETGLDISPMIKALEELEKQTYQKYGEPTNSVQTGTQMQVHRIKTCFNGIFGRGKNAKT